MTQPQFWHAAAPTELGRTQPNGTLQTQQTHDREGLCVETCNSKITPTQGIWATFSCVRQTKAMHYCTSMKGINDNCYHSDASAKGWSWRQAATAQVEGIAILGMTRVAVFLLAPSSCAQQDVSQC